MRGEEFQAPDKKHTKTERMTVQEEAGQRFDWGSLQVLDDLDHDYIGMQARSPLIVWLSPLVLDKRGCAVVCPELRGRWDRAQKELGQYLSLLSLGGSLRSPVIGATNVLAIVRAIGPREVESGDLRAHFGVTAYAGSLCLLVSIPAQQDTTARPVREVVTGLLLSPDWRQQRPNGLLVEHDWDRSQGLPASSADNTIRLVLRSKVGADVDRDHATAILRELACQGTVNQIRVHGPVAAASLSRGVGLVIDTAYSPMDPVLTSLACQHPPLLGLYAALRQLLPGLTTRPDNRVVLLLQAAAETQQRQQLWYPQDHADPTKNPRPFVGMVVGRRARGLSLCTSVSDVDGFFVVTRFSACPVNASNDGIHCCCVFDGKPRTHFHIEGLMQNLASVVLNDPFPPTMQPIVVGLYEDSGPQ